MHPAPLLSIKLENSTTRLRCSSVIEVTIAVVVYCSISIVSADLHGVLYEMPFEVQRVENADSFTCTRIKRAHIKEAISDKCGLYTLL